MASQLIAPIPQQDVLNTPQKIQHYNQTQAIMNMPWTRPDNSQASPNIISQALNVLNPFRTPQAAAQTIPSAQDAQTLPTGINLAMNYLRKQAGGQDPMQYYKALQDPNFLPKIQAAESQKPGMGNVLLMQGFHESTLGNNGTNTFGALPGGEGSGQQASFATPSDALDYQLSKNMLSGGANKNMDIMDDKNPLTFGRLRQLYKSYNPEGAYIQDLINTLSGK